jgi:hypothetical protein
MQNVKVPGINSVCLTHISSTDLKIGCLFENLKKDIELRIGRRFENLKKRHRSDVKIGHGLEDWKSIRGWMSIRVLHIYIYKNNDFNN